MNSWKTFALAGLSASTQVLGQNVVDLTGDQWTVSNKALNISVPGHLPSHAHLDLYAANAIGKLILSTLEIRPLSDQVHR